MAVHGLLHGRRIGRLCSFKLKGLVILTGWLRPGLSRHTRLGRTNNKLTPATFMRPRRWKLRNRSCIGQPAPTNGLCQFPSNIGLFDLDVFSVFIRKTVPTALMNLRI